MSTEEAFRHLYKTYFGDLQIEKEEINNLPNVLAGCDIFIDIGASLGMFTYYANKILKNSTIVAVEADPDRYNELKKNCIKWQDIRNNRISAINCVVGESRKAITFFNTGTNISGGLFPVNERSDKYRPIQIQQMTLDELFQPHKKIVVKIDVEGAEYRVMQGAKKHIEHKNTDFLIEFHWWGDREKGTTSLDLLRYLYHSNLTIHKTVKPHTSNYLFKPNSRSINTLPAYIKYSPLLVAKTIYGKYIPESVRNLRERHLNRIRSKVFMGDSR